MINRNIVFDLANERIGFADAQCDRGTVRPRPAALDNNDEDVRVGGGSDGGEESGDGDKEEEKEGEADNNGSEKDDTDQEDNGIAGGFVFAGRSKTDQERGDGNDKNMGGEGNEVGTGGGGGSGIASSEGEGDDNHSGDKDGGGGGGVSARGTGDAPGERGSAGTGRGGDGDGGGGADDGPEMACLWRLWEPCRKECEHDLPEVNGCSGKRKVRGAIRSHSGGNCEFTYVRVCVCTCKYVVCVSLALILDRMPILIARVSSPQETFFVYGQRESVWCCVCSCCALFRLVLVFPHKALLSTQSVTLHPPPSPQTTQQTRPCHTGSRCTSVKDGIYAELSFDLDLGFRSASREAMPAAAAAAYHEDRWRVRVADALAEAVSRMLPVPCGVLPGDVAVSVLPAQPDVVPEPAEKGQGVAAPLPPRRQLETVVTSVHFWRPVNEEDRAPTEEPGVALAMGGGGAVEQARCVSALAAPSVAFDVAALAALELSLAGRAASEGAAGEEEVEDAEAGRRSLGNVAGLAERMSVVQAGQLSVRSAPSDHRVAHVTSSSSFMREAGKARGGAWIDPLRPGGGGFVPSDGDSSSLDARGAPLSTGVSPVLALRVQATVIVAIGMLLVLGQRLRACSRGRNGGGGGGGGGGAWAARRRKAAMGLSTAAAGNGGRTRRALFGANEQRGNGSDNVVSIGAVDKGQHEA